MLRLTIKFFDVNIATAQNTAYIAHDVPRAQLNMSELTATAQ